MRGDDEPVELFVAAIGEREYGPVRAGFARAHLDAADDAIRAGCGGHLDAPAGGVLDIDGVGEIDRGAFGVDIDRIDGVGRRYAKEARE
jgi:hypothetical protein